MRLVLICCYIFCKSKEKNPYCKIRLLLFSSKSKKALQIVIRSEIILLFCWLLGRKDVILQPKKNYVH